MSLRSVHMCSLPISSIDLSKHSESEYGINDPDLAILISKLNKHRSQMENSIL
jgi:hypothetical protein